MGAKLEDLNATEDAWQAGLLIDWWIAGPNVIVNLPLLKIQSSVDNVFF